MIRELIRRRAVYLLAVLGLLALAGGVALWAYDRGDDSAQAQVQVVRWVNVTLAVPEDSGLTAVQDFWGPDSTPPAIFIRSLENGDSVIVIDAETGKVIEDLVQPKDRAAVDQLLQSLTVSPLDRSTAAWPYSGEPPKVPRERFVNITYIAPDPASGLQVSLQVGDRVADGSPPEPSYGLGLQNGRSILSINAYTGETFPETTSILPEDKEAFDRFLSTVQPIGP